MSSLLLRCLLCGFGSFFLCLDPSGFGGFETLPFLLLEALTLLELSFLLESPLLGHLSLPFFLFSLLLAKTFLFHHAFLFQLTLLLFLLKPGCLCSGRIVGLLCQSEPFQGNVAT